MVIHRQMKCTELNNFTEPASNGKRPKEPNRPICPKYSNSDLRDFLLDLDVPGIAASVVTFELRVELHNANRNEKRDLSSHQLSALGAKTHAQSVDDFSAPMTGRNNAKNLAFLSSLNYGGVWVQCVHCKK